MLRKTESPAWSEVNGWTGGPTQTPDFALQLTVEPDFVLPAQFYDGTSTACRSAEFRLLWAIFQDGIETYCHEVARGRTSSLDFREVHGWIFRDGCDEFTSFSMLCELFGIDARALRHWLRRFRAQPTPGVLERFKDLAA